MPMRRRLLVAYGLGAAGYSIVITTLQFAWQEPVSRGSRGSDAGGKTPGR